MGIFDCLYSVLRTPYLVPRDSSVCGTSHYISLAAGACSAHGVHVHVKRFGDTFTPCNNTCPPFHPLPLSSFKFFTFPPSPWIHQLRVPALPTSCTSTWQLAWLWLVKVCGPGCTTCRSETHAFRSWQACIGTKVSEVTTMATKVLYCDCGRELCGAAKTVQSSLTPARHLPPSLTAASAWILTVTSTTLYSSPYTWSPCQHSAHDSRLPF